MKYSIHPSASEELASAVSYYFQIEAELGVRFYLEMDRLIREVCADPNGFEDSIHRHAAILVTGSRMQSSI